ncbi:MAG: glycosyltransferase [Planctomycetota bacterium]
MISIVCAYNNATLLNDYLLMSLSKQTVNHELITVNTFQHGFQSAAEALNFGGNQATGEYIIFVHQDVKIVSATWLEDAENILNKIPNLGVAGVVGCTEKGSSIHERTRNIILHGDDMEKIGSPIKSPEKVQTLDELLLIVPKKIFEKHQFDEKTCNNWHLYGTDYCLVMATIGKEICVIPLFVVHKSKGAVTRKSVFSLSYLYNLGLNREYYHSLNRVLEKHKNNFTWIYTTTGWGKWNTTESLILQRIKYPITEILKFSFLTTKSLIK